VIVITIGVGMALDRRLSRNDATLRRALLSRGDWI
jgi:hypothetical protein